MCALTFAHANACSYVFAHPTHLHHVHKRIALNIRANVCAYVIAHCTLLNHEHQMNCKKYTCKCVRLRDRASHTSTSSTHTNRKNYTSKCVR